MRKAVQKLISNREMFRQLLARDILAILDTVNSNTWCDLVTVREQLTNSASVRHYMDLCTAQGHCYLGFNDRFYRAIQGINDKGYGLTVRKDRATGKLFAFNTNFANNFTESLADFFDDWAVDYNRGGK